MLAGEPGPARDVALLNAGAAILAGGGAHDLAAGVERAREAIDSGAAEGVLERLIDSARADRLSTRCSTLRRMSKLDELVGAAREDVERRKQAVPAEDLRDAVGTLSGSRRSARRWSGPASR